MLSHARPEAHLVHRIGWLRAAVMGANDGIVLTASLIVGVAAASGDRSQILVAGMAGLAAGAMSMAAGEYVSVSSQSDTERADIARETAELDTDPDGELDELTAIYVQRGLDPGLARQVALRLTEHDALGSHLRDELGMSEVTTAAPVQAAMVSAATFAACTGAALPLGTAALAPDGVIAVWVTGATMLALAGLGAVGAQAGGAGIARHVAGAGLGRNGHGRDGDCRASVRCRRGVTTAGQPSIIVASECGADALNDGNRLCNLTKVLITAVKLKQSSRHPIRTSRLEKANFFAPPDLCWCFLNKQCLPWHAILSHNDPRCAMLLVSQQKVRLLGVRHS